MALEYKKETVRQTEDTAPRERKYFYISSRKTGLFKETFNLMDLQLENHR